MREEPAIQVEAKGDTAMTLMKGPLSHFKQWGGAG